MTANADMNVSSGEVEDECGLDMCSYEDLPKPAAVATDSDCNGNATTKDRNGNAKDDADGSYVFVTGNEDDDPVHTTHLHPDSPAEPSLDKHVESESESENQVGDLKVPNGLGLELEGVKGCAVDVDRDAVSLLNTDLTLDDGNEGHTVAVEETNGIVSATVVEPLPHQQLHGHHHDDQNKTEDEHVEVDSTNDIQGTLESQATATEAVECHPELLLVDGGKATKSEQEHCTQLEETQESQLTDTDVTGSELNLSVKNEEKTEEENKLGSMTVVKPNLDSQIIVSKDIQNDFDLDQGKEQKEFTDVVPMEDHKKASEVDMGQSLEASTSPVAGDAEMKEVEAGDASVSNVTEDGLHTGNAQHNVAELSGVNDLVKAIQNMTEQYHSSENVEASDSSDAKTGKSIPTASDNDTIGDPTNGIPAAVVQLETVEAVNGHDASGGDGLTDTHAEESFTQGVIVNDFVHASQIAPEQNRPSEIANTPSSPVVHENANMESCDRIQVAPAGEMAEESDVGIGDSHPVDDAKMQNDMTTKTEVEKLDINSSESPGSQPVEDTKVETEAEHGPFVDDTTRSCPFTDMKPEIKNISISSESEAKVSTFPSSEVHIESEVSNGITECIVDSPDEETCVQESVENKVGSPTCPIDVMGDSEGEIMVPSKDMPGNDGLVCESKVLTGSVDASQKMLSCVENDALVENGGDQSASIDGGEKTCQEVEGIDGVHRDETSTSSHEGSIVDTSDGQNVAAEVGKRPFYYMIRIPRYDDENLKELIKQAQFEVDEKTKSRNAIQAEMQVIKANLTEYGDSFNAAKSEEKAARDLLRAKRKEIDSVQSVINRVKSAISVEDIDGRICNMEHMIQHETLPLKEEKQFIREIKQLKQLREQLSSNMGSKDEVQDALDQKDQVEKRLESLRKEVDLLRDNVLKAEAATEAAGEKYHDENEKKKELQARYKAADAIRQEAYSHFQSLRKKLYDKNKHFWKYKDDAKAANDLALKREKEELQRHCVNQVERVMELWINSDEFRKDYMRCNVRSTVRRLQTLDGRSLGPDEKPPIIPNVVSDRVAKDSIFPTISTAEVEKPVAPAELEKTDDKSTTKVLNQKNPMAKTKNLTKPAPPGNGLATVSGRDVVEETRQEEHKQTREEEELARKVEERRKEEEAAMLKEQRRLEEKTKAKEAVERKKRNAEKAQARAAQRAQKEAEQKEKEREKRARKKEKRKTAAEDANVVYEGESAPSSETPTGTESETREKPESATKRPQRPSQFTKQTKAKPMPLPLRNRGKKKMQTWMWALLTVLVVFALFLVGNSSFSFNFRLQRFGF